MTTVTTLPQSRPLTRADLETMPDDGHRYELLDGALLVTPAPVWRHQRISARLHMLLAAAMPSELEVLAAPFDVVLADDTVLQPDLLVAPVKAFTERELPKEPLLAVEILSPSTRLIDLNLKKARYEGAGCLHYWTVDPVVPSVTAWALQSGAYVRVWHVQEEERITVELPFPVAFTPQSLVVDRA